MSSKLEMNFSPDFEYCVGGGRLIGIPVIGFGLFIFQLSVVLLLIPAFEEVTSQIIIRLTIISSIILPIGLAIIFLGRVLLYGSERIQFQSSTGKIVRKTWWFLKSQTDFYKPSDFSIIKLEKSFSDTNNKSMFEIQLCRYNNNHKSIKLSGFETFIEAFIVARRISYHMKLELELSLPTKGQENETTAFIPSDSFFEDLNKVGLLEDFSISNLPKDFIDLKKTESSFIITVSNPLISYYSNEYSPLSVLKNLAIANQPLIGLFTKRNNLIERICFHNWFRANAVRGSLLLISSYLYIKVSLILLYIFIGASPIVFERTIQGGMLIFVVIGMCLGLKFRGQKTIPTIIELSNNSISIKKRNCKKSNESENHIPLQEVTDIIVHQYANLIGFNYEIKIVSKAKTIETGVACLRTDALFLKTLLAVYGLQQQQAVETFDNFEQKALIE